MPNKPQPDNTDGYYRLRDAIVLQAVQDLRNIRSGRKKESYKVNISELKQFFASEYGNMLLGRIDGEYLYERLMNEDVNESKSHPKRKRVGAV